MAQTAYITVGTGKALLDGLDPNLFMWIAAGTQIGIGAAPLQQQKVLDLVSESIQDTAGAAPSAAAIPAALPSLPMAPRARLLSHGGRYLFLIDDKIIQCSSLKDLLKKGLLAMEDKSPGLFAELTKLKGRTRRMVAQKPTDLFKDPKHAKYAEELKPGWWYGTNNNNTTTKGWLHEACQVAGLIWGKDFDVSI